MSVYTLHLFFFFILKGFIICVMLTDPECTTVQVMMLCISHHSTKHLNAILHGHEGVCPK
jgi:hypothetical protein